jgi:hypothetical protein
MSLQFLRSAIVLLLVGRVSLGGTPFHRLLRSSNLLALLPLGLHEHGQENDPPPRCNPVCDPYRPTGQIEPKFSKLAVQLSSVGFMERGTELSESIDVEPHTSCIRFGQSQEPLTNLWLKLNLTSHSVYAILPDARRSCDGTRTREGQPERPVTD